MNKYRAIIVDDERLAREEEKMHLQEYDDFEVVGTAENAGEGEELIRLLQPDLVFLDIQMPGRTGFEMLETVEFLPHIIFTTAFSDYAVKAFEVSALDYLVKPFREERFAQAMLKAKERLAERKNNQENIFVKEGEKLHFIKTADIYLITSVGNYVRLHFSGQKVYYKCSLNRMEEMLDPAFFFRSSRTEIINTSFISKVEPDAGERLSIELKTGERITMSGRRSVEFKRRNKPSIN